MSTAGKEEQQANEVKLLLAFPEIPGTEPNDFYKGAEKNDSSKQ